MKAIIIFTFSLFMSVIAYAQSIGVGTTDPDNSAVLDISSETQGLLIPRMDSTARKDIINPAVGLMVYDSTTYSFWFFRDTSWTEFHWEKVDNLGNHTATQDLDMDGQRIKNLDEPTLNSDAANKFYVDIHTDADSDVTNELQLLSISNDTIYLSDGGFVVLPDGGLFTEDAGLVYSMSSDTSDFIFGEDALPIDGIDNTGEMFFFDKSKAAFRAGRISNSENWNPDSIGLNSIALGHDTRASGVESVSIGKQTIATGLGSVALGLLSRATGVSSFSVGNLAKSIGLNSIAMGQLARSTGDFAVAIGSSAQGNGDYSIAMGQSTNAEGLLATAIGYDTDAIGWRSTAIGNRTIADSYASVALGSHNVGGGTDSAWVSSDPIFEIGIGQSNSSRANGLTILKDGTVSFKDYTFPNADGTADQVLATDGSGNVSWTDDVKGAFENNSGVVRSTGSNDDDFVLGYDELPQNGDVISSSQMFFFDNNLGAIRAGRLGSSSNWATDSLGSFSAAFGMNTLASGSSSFAVGNTAKATGIGAVSMGINTLAGGDYAFAMGNGTQATGDFSIALGQFAEASGMNSIALSVFSEASGSNSLAIGVNSDATGPSSVAIGTGADASASSAVSIGEGTSAAGDNALALGLFSGADGDVSTSMGYFTNAIGDYSTALGQRSTADAYNTTAIGRWNLGGGNSNAWIATDPIFEVGIGSGIASKANALTILKDGTVSFENYTFPDADGSTDQVLTTDGSGTISWADQQSSGVFENDGGVVKNTGNNATDDFVFGADELPTSGTTDDNLFFFDKDKAAFRAGALNNSEDWNTDSIGYGSVALGSGTRAVGNYTTALGAASIASGLVSTSIGLGTEANDCYALATCLWTKANGFASFATGSHTEANGNYSSSLGLVTKADAFGVTAIGMFNVGGGNDTTIVDSDPLFEIGNGTGAADRSNALTIYKNGVAEFTDSLHTDGHVNVGNGIGSRLYLGNTMIQSGGPTILRMETNVRPFTDNSFDLGSSGKRWKNIWATNGVIQTSDKRLKKNIEELPYGLETVLDMKPVAYHWNSEKDDDKKHVGLIAQDLLKTVPEVVSEEGEYLGVKYAELVPVLIQAIKDQQEIIDNQQGQIKSLESQNEAHASILKEVLDRVGQLEDSIIKTKPNE